MPLPGCATSGPSNATQSRKVMQHSVEFKHFEPTPELQNRIEAFAARIRTKTERLAPYPVFLRCFMEEVPAKKLYHVSLTLEVPNNTLAAKEEAHDAEVALHGAMEELERQLDAYKAALRGEQWWKQHHKREELRRMKLSGGQPGK